MHLNFWKKKGNGFIRTMFDCKPMMEKIGFSVVFLLKREKEERMIFLREKGFMGIYLGRIMEVKCFLGKYSI